MTPVDEAKLAARATARKLARAAWELVSADYESFRDDARQAFWDEMLDDEALAHTTFAVAATPVIAPMTDAEASRKDDETIRFGRFAGEKYGDHLVWVDWLAGAKHDELTELERYLANPGVAERLRQKHEELESGE